MRSWVLGLVFGSVAACAPLPRGAAERDSAALQAADARMVRAMVPDVAPLPAAVTAAESAGRPPRIAMSELLADPLLHEEGVGDYVELVVLSGEAVRLADLTLVAPNGKRLPMARPADPWLRAGEVAVVRPIALGRSVVAKGLRLPNGAGRVELWWRNRLIDVAQWQVHRRSRSRAGIAIERVDPRMDGALPSSWRLARGVVDKLERGSPGAVEWPCPALVGTALAAACRQPNAPAKTAKGRTLCGSGPSLGRWGGT